MLDIGIPESVPLGIAILLLVLNLFKKPLSQLISKSLPNMASGFFSAKAEKERDIIDFAQQKELELLKANLSTAEAERKHIEILYNQLAEREKSSMQIISEQFGFMQNLIDNRLVEVQATIIEEIMSSKRAFEVLAKHIRGGLIEDTVEKIVKKNH